MTLRIKYVNSALEYKTCFKCKESFPRDENHFYKIKHRTTKGSFKYSSYCIACERIRNQEWKKKDSVSGNKKRRQREYLSTENGYFRELWQSCKRSTHGCLFRNYEEFFQCWKEQQKIYGNRCPYLGIEMTRIKGVNINGKRAKATNTNISKDRILSNLPYGKDNLMFVSWKANNEKGNITPYIARKYLQFVGQSSLLKKLSKIDKDNLIGDKEEWFEWIETKKKITSMLDQINPTAEDVDGKSFLSKELTKLRENIGPDAMRQFLEVAFESARRERIKNET